MEIKTWKEYEEAVKTQEAIEELLDAYDPNPTQADELAEIRELKAEWNKLNKATQTWWMAHEDEAGNVSIFI